MKIPPKNLLQPGDLLVYRPSNLFGWIIAFKTWTRASHVEIYAGNHQSYAARGEGVDLYQTDLWKVGFVLRPSPLLLHGKLNLEQAVSWFRRVARGQKYDYLGLFCFYIAAAHGQKDRMFCSEFAARFYREGGFSPFSEWFDADHIAPAQFLQSPAFRIVWSDYNPGM